MSATSEQIAKFLSMKYREFIANLRYIAGILEFIRISPGRMAAKLLSENIWCVVTG